MSAKRPKQVLVKMSTGEYAVARELAVGGTVPALLRRLLIQHWKAERRKARR